MLSPKQKTLDDKFWLIMCHLLHLYVIYAMFDDQSYLASDLLLRPDSFLL